MEKNNLGPIALALLALLLLAGCAARNDGALSAAAEPDAAAAEPMLLPAYPDNHTAFPWTRYRLSLFLPDPEHSTLEAEAPPPGLIRPPEDGTSGESAHADAAPADLWDRIRAGYAFPAQKDQRIDAELSWYTRHPDYLARTVERARPYLRVIVDAIDSRGVPMEIALLPIVESAYQPFAYSHGRAAGLWQFVPGTATRYGLKQNWWYDGRRDVIASTRAALDYLEYLHGFFDGDWMLALAAYNSGEGTVRRAVVRNSAQGRPTDFWSLDLPRETRAYVPKLLALSEVFSRPEEYGITLASIADEPMIVPVDVGSQIDLAKAAELAGVGLDELYRLNPAFNRWATDPDGPHELLVPVHAAERFATALAGLAPEQRVTWTRHLIREGENLGQLARHYRTTVAVLREVNGINGHMIRAGQSLIVPVAMQEAGGYTLSAEQRQRAVQSTARSGSRSVHVVRSGDTLWDIARKHRVGVKQLAQWNGMAPGDVLRPGQRLVIWKAEGTVTASAPGRLLDAPPVSEATQRISYVVRKGDSLSRISQRFNVKVSELLRWNSLAKGDYLQPGQRLTLYVDVTRQTANL